ncbi:2-amino-4-hydroxy-6-hydroxymethyldihydropteridine diphosphokinase [Helicobacter burdigaliensis]|uniref:2-amino-4-hydroxy-6- hydroxymethyldihydropteridine diphosphokinase n=1 Tax=Helicobacter burdigaliensis TaxID=2315334 RepID=UPI001E53091A|nr:2-amino-4-hydroxy-6-hydroxymethyldihydropteridine diphosphokinase [Helicobacter burdigaliensis]
MKSKSFYALKTYQKKQIKERFIEYKPKKIQKPFNKTQKISAKLKRVELLRNPDPFMFYKKPSVFKGAVLLGVGGNVGDVLVTFWKLFKRLKVNFDIMQISPFLKNPAFGYTEQEDFYNALVWLKMQKGYVDFFAYMSYLERVFGRKRKREFKNAPRTLDIDILSFKGKRINLAHMCIPHREWIKRESIILPLKG